MLNKHHIYTYAFIYYLYMAILYVVGLIVNNAFGLNTNSFQFVYFMAANLCETLSKHELFVDYVIEGQQQENSSLLFAVRVELLFKWGYWARVLYSSWPNVRPFLENWAALDSSFIKSLGVGRGWWRHLYREPPA